MLAQLSFHPRERGVTVNRPRLMVPTNLERRIVECSILLVGFLIDLGGRTVQEECRRSFGWNPLENASRSSHRHGRQEGNFNRGRDFLGRTKLTSSASEEPTTYPRTRDWKLNKKFFPSSNGRYFSISSIGARIVAHRDEY